MNKSAAEISPLMKEVSTYIATALKRSLPAEVVEKGKHHILDTMAASISGTKLAPGLQAVSYVKTLGGKREACVMGTRIVTSAANAAFANGMCAHADETDDSHHPSNTHPGCAVVPAAFAMAERGGLDGKSMLRAVVLGYDIGCRVTRSLHSGAFRIAGHSNHSFGGIFGAAAAAGALARLDAGRASFLLSYAAQQASGIRTFERDSEHVLKAFVFGGMTARDGVWAATMVANGFTGVPDEFSGRSKRTFFSIYSPDPSPDEMVRGLGADYEVMNTNIKKWSVGSPIQSALDSMLALMTEHKITADDVEKMVVLTPEDGSAIVNDSRIPDINMQHLLAVMLIDGTVTFQSAHDARRMKDKRVLALKQRMQFVGSPELTAARPSRQCIIELTTRDGRNLKHRTHAVRGTPHSPMSRAEVGAKAFDLVAPILGKRRAQALVDSVWRIEKISDVSALRPLLTA